MTTPTSALRIDGQWIDYYALLGVPAGADEDSIRRRIGKVYAEAASNSDHRNLARREYYQSLVERVLPQCRRVMLDPEWRARYDEQHRLHRENNSGAQDYIEFIASMRGDGGSGLSQALLPQRAREDIDAARRVVECALSGAELELLPSQAISQRPALDATPGAPISDAQAFGAMACAEMACAETATHPDLDLSAIPQANTAPAALPEDEPEEVFAPRGKKRRNLANAPVANAPVANAPVANAPVANAPVANAPVATAPVATAVAPAPLEIVAQVSRVQPAAPQAVTVAATPMPVAAQSIEVAESAESASDKSEDFAPRKQQGEAARATVITAQEAADIRRRRASNPNPEPFVGPTSRDDSSKKSRSRVVVEADDPALKRKLSPTSLNLMVAITGVLLTITIQHFADTPAIATSAGRTPIVLAVAPEMEAAIERAGVAWQKTPAGASYEIVVQSVDSSVAMQRALGKSGDQIDGWIPASSSYWQRYNELAPAAKRPPLQVGDSLAQTPLVLVAQTGHADALRRAFPDHKIGNWTALRAIVMQNANGHFGLSDPRQSLPGAAARYSMAREWGAGRGKSAQIAAKDPNFWKWMAGFEENVPSSAVSSDAMVKDMVLGTTGRYFWAVSYESDALNWIGQGKPLELFYLPRTTLADHPFCAVERVGAPVEVANGRAAFLDYMKNDDAQKMLLQSGFRPTEISPSAAVEKNPFTTPRARLRGVQLQGLPRDERFNIGALGALEKQWSHYYG